MLLRISKPLPIITSDQNVSCSNPILHILFNSDTLFQTCPGPWRTEIGSKIGRFEKSSVIIHWLFLKGAKKLI